MIVSRTLLRRSLKAGGWLVLLLGWLLSLFLILAWITQSTLDSRERQVPPPGKMVLAAGEWVHLDCRGHGQGPVWFLESGAMGWSTVWEWVQRDLARDHRVCTWDRPGMGWSRPTTRPADAASSSAVLHDLVRRESPHQKIVLVGHSLGAILSLTYQANYPDDLAALVLLDPAHPQQLSRLPNRTATKTLNQVELLSGSMPWFEFGAGRSFVQWRPESVLNQLPADALPAVVHVVATRSHIDRSVQEYQAWPQSSREAMRAHLGGLPLLVVSCSNREHGDREANRVWWSLHQGLASLSARGRWEVAPDTSHQSLVMEKEPAQRLTARLRAFEQAWNLSVSQPK